MQNDETLMHFREQLRTLVLDIVRDAREHGITNDGCLLLRGDHTNELAAMAGFRGLSHILEELEFFQDVTEFRLKEFRK